MESGVRQMVISGAVINLSNLIWSDTADLFQKERSAFLVEDFWNEDLQANDRNFFDISFGEHCFEDGIADRAYLAVLRRDGSYVIEPMRGYMDVRNGRMVLDLLKLPSEIQGVRLHKAACFRRTRLDQWRDGGFRREGGGQTGWVMEGGNMVILVIGANSTGKSHFIEQNFKGYTILDIYDRQKRVREDDRFHGLSEWEKMFQANELLKADIVELVRQGKDVVVEQTFFRALRRIGYIDAIQEVSRKIPIVVYVMTPSDEQLWKNCEKRSKETGGDPQYAYERIKRERSEVFEFPDPAEGFSRIYEVSDSRIAERMDKPDWTRIEQARRELADEEKARQKKKEESERREKLTREMEHIRFWHYCEVCGKKELLTPEEAFEQGWDYPPRMGRFRILSPRTCGNCSIADTLYIKLVSGGKTFSDLSEEEKAVLARIMNEPESLLPSEDEL